MMKKILPWLQLLAIFAAVGIVGYLGVRGVQQATDPVIQLRQDLDAWMTKLTNPTPTVMPDPVTVVREVRALSRLETIQYSVEKVITAETGQGTFGFLFGDRLLLVAHGMVIAGVDMGEVGPEDVEFDEGGRVYLTLPEAEIFVATLDNEKSYVYDRDTGLLTRGDIHLEEAARRAAEAEIERAAREDGILEQAEINAENYLYRFLRSLGFPDVIFREP